MPSTQNSQGNGASCAEEPRANPLIIPYMGGVITLAGLPTLPDLNTPEMKAAVEAAEEIIREAQQDGQDVPPGGWRIAFLVGATLVAVAVGVTVYVNGADSPQRYPDRTALPQRSIADPKGGGAATPLPEDPARQRQQAQADKEKGPVFHRKRGRSQTDENAVKQVASGEIWGGVALGGSLRPVVQAYTGELPPGFRGIEFQTLVPYDARGMSPGQVEWSGPRAGVDVFWDPVQNREFAKIKVLIRKVV